MAYRVANSNTSLTSATGWDTVTNTPTIHASTGISISTSPLYSQAYTAPNTTNSATGVAVNFASVGYYASGNLTVTATLQEYNGSTWSDTSANSTITIATSNVGAADNRSWVYFVYGTPYVFTTTSTGYYRIKITRSTATGNPTLRADSGGSNFAFLATDNRTGALASNDNLFVLGINYANTDVTIDGTTSIGSGLGALEDISLATTLNAALYVGTYGRVNADTTASATITCTGHVVMAVNSEFNIGSSSADYPSSYVFNWKFNPTASCDFSIRNFNGNINWYGTSKYATTWRTEYLSGSGTAADPLITSDAVDWSVGDEISILASSNNSTNYNETEYRFIKTKNSSTSYVLSNTRGGAESALTYTHTNAEILNLERNVIFETTDTTKGFFLSNSNAIITNSQFSNGSIIYKWVRFNTIGRTAGGAPYYGQFTINSTSYMTFDYNVIYNPLYYSWYGGNSVRKETYYGNILIKGPSGGNYMLYLQNMAQKTFSNCYLVDNYSQGLVFAYGSTNLFYQCVFNSGRRSGSGSGGVVVSICTNTIFRECKINCCRTAVFLSTNTESTVFENCEFGTNGYNYEADLMVNSSPGYSSVKFLNTTFGSPTLWSSSYPYSLLINGSEVSIHKKNTTDNKHFWYSPNGVCQSTGYGLEDTLVRTPGSLNVRLAPNNTDPGLTWKFYIPANKNQVITFFGYFLKNTAMGTDVCTVSLFLPGNPTDGTPDATATLSDNVADTWTGSAAQYISLALNYTGSVDAFATVVINAKSSTSGAYLYCADFYNSGDSVTLYDKVAGLTLWNDGKPSPIISQYSLGGIAPAVWGIATSGLTSSGTIGKLVIDMATNNDIKG